MKEEALIPQIGVIIKITEETPEVKTFRVVDRDGRKPFDHMPGQCGMISLPGVGEAMFSITSSPTQTEYMEFSIKECGHLTNALFAMEVGQEITVRGPYGNGFPVETEFIGKDFVFIAGGIGFAPLHSVINYMRDKKENYGSMQVIYGARSKEDFTRYEEITEEWMKDTNMDVQLTIDQEQDTWDGHVGFVPNFVKELEPDTSKTILLCGPPIMIKFTLEALRELGFEDTQVYTTMELRMKCGVGKCGRCNIGSKYVCKDGPVFRFDELGELPDEY